MLIVSAGDIPMWAFKHSEPQPAKVRVHDFWLCEMSLKNWRDEMENKQKASTINRKLAALSAFYA